jgi:hypothetical protein
MQYMKQYILQMFGSQWKDNRRNEVLAEGAEFLTSYVNLKTAWNNLHGP